MENRTPQETEKKQINHAGNPDLPASLREVPVEEFDTPLHVAEKQGKLSPLPTEEAKEPNYNKKNRKKGLIAGASLVATGIIASGALIIGLGQSRDTQTENDNVPPAPDPAATSEVQPTTEPDDTEIDTDAETEFEVFGLPSLESLQVSSSQSDEEIARGLISIIDQWQMSGANKEMFDQSLQSDNVYLSLDEYSAKVAETSADVYATALYGEDYATNEGFVESVEQFTRLNETLLVTNYQTYGDQNQAPYMIELSLDKLNGVVENPDGTFTYSLSLVERDNTSLNIVEGDVDSENRTSHMLTVDKSGSTVHLTTKPTFQQ